MAGYRRFIAYVYEYPQGKKGNGKGFIKVEARDGVCRLQYKLAGIYGKESVPGRIYGYVRKDGVCRGIPLGECDMAGNSIQFEHEMEEENMGRSGYTLNDLCGLVLIADSGELYGSGWDEQPVDFAEIRFPEELGKEKRGEDEYEKMEVISAEMNDKTEMREKTETNDKTEIEEEVKIQKEEEIPEEAPEQNRVPEGQQEITIENVSEPEEQTLFSDNSISDCKKITPADFGMLSRRDRGLINNKFLCHGYSGYGHLILGRREEDGRYILGVPGIYECQESLMAGMFGFPYFKETGRRNGSGRFGYWYRLIDEPDFDMNNRA